VPASKLERAESLAPAEYPLIYLLRAHALLSMKQFPEAMAALQAYLQKDPKGAMFNRPKRCWSRHRLSWPSANSFRRQSVLAEATRSPDWDANNVPIHH